MRLSTLLVFLVAVLPFSADSQLAFDFGWPHSKALIEELKGTPDGELNVAEAYTEANRLIIEENWEEAEALLAQLWMAAPDNRNFAYKWALCLRALPGRIEEAVPLVHLAVDGPFADRYNAFSADEQLPPEDALELGLEVLQHAYHFSEAQGLAHVVIARYPKRDYRHQRAQEVIAECSFAMDCVSRPLQVDIRAESQLNSPQADYAPVLSPDGQTLYFTSHRTMGGRMSEESRIYRSVRTENGWSQPVRLEIGTNGRQVSTVGLMGDDDALLAYQGYRNEGGLWKLQRDKAGGWTVEEKLGFPIDSRHWETSISERFDGAERIFVSDRPGGQGGRDLYRTVKLPDGTWSEPLNLGVRINTPGEEESPVISADGRTLVFASDGHPGMGGFDLYRCRRLDNGSWSDPEHMGHPLNTPGDEAVLSLDAAGNRGFISSARAGGDNLDIYSVHFPEAAGEALAMLIGEVPRWENGDVMEVRSTDDGPAVFRVFRSRPGSGKFFAALPPCRDYDFRWIRGGEVLHQRFESVGCGAAYGATGAVQRLDVFDWDGQWPEESPELAAEMESEVAEAAPSRAETVRVEAESKPTHVFPVDDEAAVEAGEAAVPVAMMEFAEVTQSVEFGYGQYIPDAGSDAVAEVAARIVERREQGEVPVVSIEGSASFVPVRNKRAYETNEQLARMRAENARDAMITALAEQGLQVGVDFQIVLEWGVAGPQYKGDALASEQVYRSFQFAKFHLARSLVELRH